MAKASNADVEKSLLRDQRFIIEQSREELVNDLDLLGTDLIELMVKNRVINQREANVIMSQDAEEEQVQILLNRMSRKTSQQFNTFCACMDQAGMASVRQRLLSYDTVIGRCLEEMQQKLCRYFVESYSQVDMLSLHDEGHRVRLDQIYVPIKWATYVQTPDGMKKQHLEAYTDIFKETKGKVFRILVRGDPMAGKTTFLRKVSFDWAQTVQGTFSSSHHIGILQRYLLCLPIILRLVTKDSNLTENIEHQLDFLSSRDLKTIEWMLDQDPSKVLVVFDGLDEYNLETCANITNIIMQKEAMECCCVVTSRGEGVSKLEKWKTVFQIDSELLGFGDAEIEKYVNLYFENKKLGEELLSLIIKSKSGYYYSANKYLYEMACNPGRLGILCLLWKENKNLGKDRNALYKEYICLLLKLAEERLSSFKDTNLGPTDKLSTHHDELISFGKLALKRNSKKEMQTIFTLQEVEEVVNAEAMKYGFMFKSHPVSRMQHTQVSFIHKTVQEWLAAYFIYHTEAWDKLVYEDSESFIADFSLHQFLVSFDEEMFEKYLKCVVVKKGNLNFAKCLISLGKAMDVDLTIGDLLAKVVNTSEWKLSDCQCNAAHIKLTASKDSIFRPTQVEKLNLRRSALQGAGSYLGWLLLRMPACTHLNLGWCHLEAGDLERMVDILGVDKLAVQVLDLGVNTLKGAGLSLGRLLLLMPACTHLNLGSCKLEPADLTNIVNMLGGNNLPIKELRLLFNRGLHEAGDSLGRMLLLMPDCTLLDVQVCGLTTKDLDDMTKAIGDKTLPLETMCLYNNHFNKNDPAVCRLLTRLPRCTCVWNIVCEDY